MAKNVPHHYMASSIDPFPAVSMTEAKRLLRRFLGRAAVLWEQPFGPVLIRVPLANGAIRIRRFTWQQAKYLAVHPESLIIGRYPVDWPSD